MAREVGQYGICVNSVAPGFILTEGRQVDPEYERRRNQQRCFQRSQVEDEVWGTVLILATAESDCMTGQLLCIDGGTHFL